MEDYQPAMASTLAAALATPESPHPWDFGFAVQEIQEYAGKMVELYVEGKAEALRVVQKLRRNLGHPTTKSLVELLQSRGASDTVIQVAGSYVCAACQRYKRPNQPAPSALSDVHDFNEKVQSDVFWIKDQDVKYPILSTIDMATKYQTAALIHREQTQELILGLERSWISVFGPPSELISDEGRAWVSDGMMEWTDSHSIKHTVAPGEAHTRLSLVERRHAVLRKSIEVMMTDLDVHGPEGIRMALTYILPQLNGQPTVAGFSPSQWVLGYQPALGNLLTSDQITPVHLAGGSTFEQALQRRNVAKTAIMQADSDQRLRRALLRRYAGDNIKLAIGQTCYYWRDAQQGDLVKIRWKGPAKVLMVEYDDAGKVTTYWICHKTQLLRCAPHHVRPDFNVLASNVIDNLQEAKAVLQQAKSRGVARFLDLNRLNLQHIDDVGEDEEGMSEGSIVPEAKRRRLELTPAPEVEYEPSEPDDNMHVPPVPNPDLPDQPQAQAPDDFDLDEMLNELEEPSAEVFPPTPLNHPDDTSTPPTTTIQDENNPHLQQATTQQPSPTPALDSQTAERYAQPIGETFQQQRLRVDRQETMSFGPSRPTLRPHDAMPYSRPSATEDLADVAFHVEDIQDDGLPSDWCFHTHTESGYFQLRPGTVNRDFWEIKAGCLLRHHVHPRKTLFNPTGFKDIPVPVNQLDNIRVTVHHSNDGQVHSFTDSFLTHEHYVKDLRRHNLPSQWHGVTIFQISAETRRELGMSAQVSNAKKIAQDSKVHQKRQFRRDTAKNKGEVSEKNLTQAEKELFYQAKVKELQSFFECGVWEFSSTSEADPHRTLTSRILLKWSKNADGTPRAKARLVVRGFQDADALEGNLDTASPTTSRLSRSLLLSISATLKWPAWSSDVATAFLQGLPQERKLWLKLPAEALRILGADADCRMFLVKPVYGQLDAPRRWYLEARKRLTRLNWKAHILDPCLFMLFDKPNQQQGDDSLELSHPRLIGLLILHVDDMLAAGDVNCPTYLEAEKLLKETFNFRSWDSDSKTIEYCGIHLERKDFTWEIHQSEYWKKVKPVTIHKGRSAEDEMNDHDKTQLRALLGSIQWPAVQTSPHIQRSASLISGQQKTNKLRAVIEANQLLKFAKTNMDLRLRYEPLDVESLDEVRLCIMFDAAHGVREDHTSQGGYFAFLTTDKIFQTESTYHIVDWRSFKLPRVARSSLSAEAQACGQSADIAEYICRFWACILRPPDQLRDRMDETSTLSPILITDAKALFDSYHKESLAGASSVDKRTGLEIRVAKEQVSSLNGSLKWVSSERQYADGLTKMSTRVLLADRIRYHKMKLVWDPDYVSAKKKDAASREASRNEFATKGGKGKDSQQQPTMSTNFTTSTTATSPNQLNHINEERETMMMDDDERETDETYRAEIEETYRAHDDEPYVPVEAYAGYHLPNMNLAQYALMWYAMLPAAGAMHVPPDHEDGRIGIQWTGAILALMMLLLIIVTGCFLGSRRRRILMQREMDRAYERLDQLQRDCDNHAVAVRDYAAMNVEFRQRLDLLATERLEADRTITALREELSATCAESARNQRGANVMAIMMATQIEMIRSLQNRVGLLKGMIRNHPCPLGGYLVVQVAEHGAVWHVDPDCPILTLNPIHASTECDHCPHCSDRDTNLFDHWAFRDPV